MTVLETRLLEQYCVEVELGVAACSKADRGCLLELCKASNTVWRWSLVSE